MAGLIGSQLSGGQKQRIVIATSDKENEKLINGTLEAIRLDNDVKTTITISHNKNSLQNAKIINFKGSN